MSQKLKNYQQNSVNTISYVMSFDVLLLLSEASLLPVQHLRKKEGGRGGGQPSAYNKASIYSLCTSTVLPG